MTTTLALSHIHYAVSSKLTILDDISFSLEPNTITGLLGINGAGKSTLLSICSGQLLPTSGSLTRASKIGYLPEVAPLIPSLSVEQYLTYIAELHNVKLGNKELSELLTICDLLSRRTQRIATLSKGNRQRVGIAQAILHKPALLLLDEPMSGLDPSQIIQFRELLMRLKETTTILFSTHILSEIDTLCDQSIILHNKTTQVVTHEQSTHYQVSILGHIEHAEADFDGTNSHIICSDQPSVQHLLAKCVEQNWMVIEIKQHKNTPERAFLNAITTSRKVDYA